MMTNQIFSVWVGGGRGLLFLILALLTTTRAPWSKETPRLHTSSFPSSRFQKAADWIEGGDFYFFFPISFSPPSFRLLPPQLRVWEAPGSFENSSASLWLECKCLLDLCIQACHISATEEVLRKALEGRNSEDTFVLLIRWQVVQQRRFRDKLMIKVKVTKVTWNAHKRRFCWQSHCSSFLMYEFIFIIF